MTNTQTSLETKVPFYRPELTENEVEEVTAALKSGWFVSSADALKPGSRLRL